MRHIDNKQTASAPETRIKAIEQTGYDEATEQFKMQGCFSSGRTWENDDEANEAYDRGVNRAEVEHKRTIPAEKPTDAPNYYADAMVEDLAATHARLLTQAAQLAEALRDLADITQRIGAPAITQGGLCEEQDWDTATRKAAQALAAYEEGK